MSGVGHNHFAHIDPEAIATELSKRGMAWADANAAAEALEEAQKSVLAEVTNDYRPDAKSMAEAETLARADERYTRHVKAMVEARRMANRARVAFDTYKAWLELKRSQVATERAAMTMR